MEYCKNYEQEDSESDSGFNKAWSDFTASAPSYNKPRSIDKVAHCSTAHRL